MTSPITYNFCAGPAALPAAVMQKAQAEMLDWQGLGISVMEISHRSSEYQALTQKAEANFRQLMGISDEFAVLFMHGGASQQFSNIPMSLLQQGGEAEYLTNGIWSQKAAVEAARFGKVNNISVVSDNPEGKRQIIAASQWARSDSPIYTHYTPNETIEGLRFSRPVQSSGAVVADLSSCILSEVINTDDYDFIYAGAQKNIGPAGLTLSIVRRSLFEKMSFDGLPKVFNYASQDKQGSMLNTPPTYAWYLAALVFEWLLQQGGVEQMEKQAIAKSGLLYQCIDTDDFYTNPVAMSDRSRMNIPFVLADSALDDKFLAEAKTARLVGLKGHRSVGGMRASLYNAMPVEGVEVLCDFMLDFKRRHG